MKLYNLQCLIVNTDTGEIVAERNTEYNDSKSLEDYSHRFLSSCFRGLYISDDLSFRFNLSVRPAPKSPTELEIF